MNLSKIVDCRTFNRKAFCIAFHKSVKAVDIFGVGCGYCCLHRQEYIYSKPAVKRPVGSSFIYAARSAMPHAPPSPAVLITVTGAFTAAVHCLCVFLAVLSVTTVGTAGVGTGTLWSSGHGVISLNRTIYLKRKLNRQGDSTLILYFYYSYIIIITSSKCKKIF